MRPRGQVFNAKGDCLSVPIETRVPGMLAVERFDFQSPRLGDFDQRERVDKPIRFCPVRERFAVGLLAPEDRYAAEADNGHALGLLAVIVGFFNLPRARGENVESMLALFHVPSDLFPLPETACIIESRQRGQELIRPAPRAARHVVGAVNEDRGERFGNVA